MSKIKRIDRVETGRYTYGTNFVKGDYIPTETHFIVRPLGKAAFEVARTVILSFFPGKKRVSQNMLESFKGKDADLLR